MAALASKLQNIQLLILDLNVCECTQITDAGVAALSAQMPGLLQQLTLNLYGCAQISDAGVAALSANLSSTLQQLDLNFICCGEIADAGIAALGAHLPRNLEQLILQLANTSVSQPVRDHCQDPKALIDWASRQAHAVTRAENTVQLARSTQSSSQGHGGATSSTESALVVAKVADALSDEEALHSDTCAKSMLSYSQKFDKDSFEKKVLSCLVIALGQSCSLQQLSLNFDGRDGKPITDAGVAAMGANLPRTLQELSLSFNFCEKITDAGVAALGANLLSTLRELSLDFRGCEQITDAGVAALGANLPSTLQNLSLNFLGCERITDAGVAALGANLPSTLQDLSLEFFCCEQVAKECQEACSSGPEALVAWVSDQSFPPVVPARAARSTGSVDDCPGCHGLFRFMTPHAGFVCDSCDRSMPQGSPMWGCRTCDWDVCESNCRVRRRVFLDPAVMMQKSSPDDGSEEGSLPGRSQSSPAVMNLYTSLWFRKSSLDDGSENESLPAGSPSGFKYGSEEERLFDDSQDSDSIMMQNNNPDGGSEDENVSGGSWRNLNGRMEEECLPAGSRSSLPGESEDESRFSGNQNAEPVMMQQSDPDSGSKEESPPGGSRSSLHGIAESAPAQSSERERLLPLEDRSNCARWRNCVREQRCAIM